MSQNLIFVAAFNRVQTTKRYLPLDPGLFEVTEEMLISSRQYSIHDTYNTLRTARHLGGFYKDELDHTLFQKAYWDHLRELSSHPNNFPDLERHYNLPEPEIIPTVVVFNNFQMTGNNTISRMTLPKQVAQKVNKALKQTGNTTLRFDEWVEGDQVWPKNIAYDVLNYTAQSLYYLDHERIIQNQATYDENQTNGLEPIFERIKENHLKQDGELLNRLEGILETGLYPKGFVESVKTPLSTLNDDATVIPVYIDELIQLDYQAGMYPEGMLISLDLIDHRHKYYDNTFHGLTRDTTTYYKQPMIRLTGILVEQGLKGRFNVPVSTYRQNIIPTQSLDEFSLESDTPTPSLPLSFVDLHRETQQNSEEEEEVSTHCEDPSLISLFEEN